MPRPHFKRPGFDEIAEALGYLLIHWSDLDREIDSLLMTLNEEGSKTSRNVSIMLPLINFQEKLNIAKYLGFISAPSRDWCRELEKSLNSIQSHNGLCTERNRLVHDAWTTESDPSRILQWRQRPSIKKPQSRDHKVLESGKYDPVTAEDIWELNGRIIDMVLNLRRLKNDLLPLERRASFDIPTPLPPQRK